MKKGFYSKKIRFWYDNTYKSLGYNWLFKTILLLDLKPGFKLLSPSGNKGYYEYNVYLELENKLQPTFYVSDLTTTELEGFQDTYNNFIHFKDNKNALEIDMPSESIDVILDIKGALWHIVNDKTKNHRDSKDNTINLLFHYYSLLKNDNSFLVFDYYKSPPKFYFYNIINKHKKPRIVNYFGERSTFEVLKRLLKRVKFTNYINILDVHESNLNKPLASQMGTAFIYKKDIFKLINELKKIRYTEFNLYRNPLNFILKGLIYLDFVLIVGVFFLFLRYLYILSSLQ